MRCHEGGQLRNKGNFNANMNLIMNKSAVGGAPSFIHCRLPPHDKLSWGGIIIDNSQLAKSLPPASRTAVSSPTSARLITTENVARPATTIWSSSRAVRTSSVATISQRLRFTTNCMHIRLHVAAMWPCMWQNIINRFILHLSKFIFSP